MRHNLLPKEKKKNLRTEYLLRAINVGVLFLAVVVCMGTIALVPAYLRVWTDLANLTEELDATAQATEVTEFKAAESLLKESAYTISILEQRMQERHFTNIIQDALNLLPDGVQITGMAFERETGTLVLEGVAGTRDNLVGYKQSLEEQDGVKSVTSPISNLAKSVDLPFQLSLEVDTSPHVQ